jgi:glycosyltransferase involved in cell wall biosynthesis
MTKITVITPTYRLLYKEKQIEALAAQSFQDFEWVVIDDDYENNKGFKTPFPLIHIPVSKPVPYFALAASFNDGLSRCSGKYVFFMNDYVVPEKYCLERHWEIQERFGGCMLSGIDIATEGTPAVINGEKVLLRDFRMTLFDTETFKSTRIDDDLREIGREGVQNWYAGHNDSCPLKSLIECNGFDEAFDGKWGGQDAEMGNRLMTLGLHYYLDKKSTCYFYPHPKGGGKQSYRSEVEQQSLQQKIINPKVTYKIYTANTQWFVMIPRDIKTEWESNHADSRNGLNMP